MIMQDIDFGRIYRNRSKTGQGHLKTEHVKNPVKNKLIIIGTIAFAFFVVGIFTGLRIQEYRITSSIEASATDAGSENNEEITTANVNTEETEDKKISDSVRIDRHQAGKNASAEKEKDLKKKLEAGKDSYLILASIYSEKKEAHYQGHKLRKAGLPVFLARNGQKLKLYVGPVKGRSSAYEMLAKVKNMPQFNGAILYKK